MTADQLQDARARSFRQDGRALLTADEAGAWLREAGLALLAPRPREVAAPAPTLAEAVAGRAEAAPGAPLVEPALRLLRRLQAAGECAPLLLLPSAHAGDRADYLATAETLPFVYALRGDREWARGPRGKSTPLTVEVWKLLGEAGQDTLTAGEVKDRLGRQLTETAALRALGELWAALRVEPVLLEGAETGWRRLEAAHGPAMAAGAAMGHATALSALVSLYLQAAVAATGEEVEAWLAPLASRSRVREALRGLAATRQVGVRALGPQEHFYVEGSLPEFGLGAGRGAEMSAGMETGMETEMETGMETEMEIETDTGIEPAGDEAGEPGSVERSVRGAGRAASPPRAVEAPGSSAAAGPVASVSPVDPVDSPEIETVEVGGLSVSGARDEMVIEGEAGQYRIEAVPESEAASGAGEGRRRFVAGRAGAGRAGAGATGAGATGAGRPGTPGQGRPEFGGAAADRKKPFFARQPWREDRAGSPAGANGGRKSFGEGGPGQGRPGFGSSATARPLGGERGAGQGGIGGERGASGERGAGRGGSGGARPYGAAKPRFGGEPAGKPYGKTFGGARPDSRSVSQSGTQAGARPGAGSSFDGGARASRSPDRPFRKSFEAGGPPPRKSFGAAGAPRAGDGDRRPFTRRDDAPREDGAARPFTPREGKSFRPSGAKPFGGAGVRQGGAGGRGFAPPKRTSNGGAPGGGLARPQAGSGSAAERASENGFPRQSAGGFKSRAAEGVSRMDQMDQTDRMDRGPGRDREPREGQGGVRPSAGPGKSFGGGAKPFSSKPKSFGAGGGKPFGAARPFRGEGGAGTPRRTGAGDGAGYAAGDRVGAKFGSGSKFGSGFKSGPSSGSEAGPRPGRFAPRGEQAGGGGAGAEPERGSFRPAAGTGFRAGGAARPGGKKPRTAPFTSSGKPREGFAKPGRPGAKASRPGAGPRKPFGKGPKRDG